MYCQTKYSNTNLLETNFFYMKIITIIGARPQFIKAAVVSRVLKNFSNIEEKIIHTGQHFDRQMSDVFFEEMEIPKPHVNLNINGLSHGAMTGQMLEGIEKILVKEKPNYVLVYGDTNSTLAGALAAKKIHIDVIHVEAGLRSFEMKMPEEINRVLTDRISNILFCPTETSVNNLKREGFDDFSCQIVQCGDVMYDAALFYAQYSNSKSSVIKKNSLNKEFVLCTIHRAENTDNILHLSNIIEALNEITQTYEVVVPIHPRTKKIIEQHDFKVNFKIIDPVGYFDILELLKYCKLVITDSGGLQKEAYYFKKNCITIREQTEWTELVINGFNICTGTNKIKIMEGYEQMLIRDNNFDLHLYGNGNAGTQIVQHLINI